MSINNLAVRLDEITYRAEGLAAVNMAAEVYQVLADLNTEEHLPHVAASIAELAIHVSEAASRAEELAGAQEVAVQEALDLHLLLADLNPDALFSTLSPRDFLTRLSEVTYLAEVLATAQRAAADATTYLRQVSAEINHNTNVADLATSVDGFANRLSEATRHAESLALASEAVGVYRELVDVNRDTQLPHLADSIDKVAVRLNEAVYRAQGRRGGCCLVPGTRRPRPRHLPPQPRVVDQQSRPPPPRFQPRHREPDRRPGGRRSVPGTRRPQPRRIPPHPGRRDQQPRHSLR